MLWWTLRWSLKGGMKTLPVCLDPIPDCFWALKRRGWGHELRTDSPLLPWVLSHGEPLTFRRARLWACHIEMPAGKLRVLHHPKELM